MQAVYQKRQQQLINSMLPNSIAILPSAELMVRTGDSTFHFRQDSDFYYMTGFPEPEAFAVFVKEQQTTRFILFVRPRDPQHELWDGLRSGLEGAKTKFGADEAYDIKELDQKMPELIANTKQIYCQFGKNKQLDEQLAAWLQAVRRKIRSGINAPTTLLALNPIIHEMRLRKSSEELNLMRKANEISKAAHLRAMQVCKPNMMEYQIGAEFMHEIMRRGSQQTAYTSIIGGGKNSCILHYIENTEKLNDGELVLIDAGCEYENYSSDITRTFPINGKFTPEQKAIYEIVLDAQLAAIEIAKPKLPWFKLQETVIQVITEGLVRIGLLKGNVSDLIAKQAYLPFYMHNSGHWLGLDTHDAGNYKVDGDWRLLEPNMVLTVEPGIYIGTNPNVDKKWHNIGIRIEDDIVITENGHENLTEGLIKSVADIENTVGTAN